MRITSQGQVTIPQYIREALGLLANTEVEFVLEDGWARLVKSKKATMQAAQCFLQPHL